MRRGRDCLVTSTIDDRCHTCTVCAIDVSVPVFSTFEFRCIRYMYYGRASPHIPSSDTAARGHMFILTHARTSLKMGASASAASHQASHDSRTPLAPRPFIRHVLQKALLPTRMASHVAFRIACGFACMANCSSTARHGGTNLSSNGNA